MNKAEHKECIFNGILELQKRQFKQLHKRSNMAKTHWSCEENMELFGKMDLKFDKLFDLIHENTGKKKQKKLCVHIANYTMMILDNLTKETEDGGS